MDKILQEYDEAKKLLDNMDKTLNSLIVSLLEQRNIKAHQVQTRVKDRSSLKNKIIKKSQKYKALDEITDIVGVRIITYFEDEVDQIATMIEEEFTIDQENSVDKRKVDSDKFGYRSLHYVASLKKDRTELAEYSNYKERKFEFQIRSILQHSWAEIEHDLGYKGEFEIPSTAKRTFYRVAALLEQADIEFVKLKSTIKEYESNVSKGIKETPSQIEINKASLLSFIATNENIVKFENELIESNPYLYMDRDSSENFVNKKLINRIKVLGIENIEQLEKLYQDNLESIKNYTLETMLLQSASGIVQGASVLWLTNILLDN